MNKNILLPVLAALLLPLLYFLYLEGFDANVLRKAPAEFITQAKNVFGIGIEREATESESALEFLENLPEIDPSVVVEELPVVIQEPKTSYQVELSIFWSEGTHTGYFPQGAHISPFVAWSHSGGNRLFAVGESASPGIEKMAELGGTITLEQEIIQKQGDGVFEYIIAKKGNVPTTITEVIEVDERHPRISLVTMIAPSPDWFATVIEETMIIDGEFVDEITIPLVMFDAGTEEGKAFSISNNATEPQGVIAPLTDIPVDSLNSFGAVTFKKI